MPREMTNLREETLKELESKGLTKDDVLGVIVYPSIYSSECICGTWITMDAFLSMSDFEYYAGYGGEEITQIVIFTKYVIFLRYTYDGAEWWQSFDLRGVPKEIKTLRTYNRYEMDEDDREDNGEGRHDVVREQVRGLSLVDEGEQKEPIEVHEAGDGDSGHGAYQSEVPAEGEINDIDTYTEVWKDIWSCVTQDGEYAIAIKDHPNRRVRPISIWYTHVNRGSDLTIMSAIDLRDALTQAIDQYCKLVREED